MILQGKDLIIAADNKVIAGAKSCSLEIDADIIPVSSPTNGQWEHSIPGMKSWKVSTNHLVGMNEQPAHIIKAVGSSNNGVNIPASYCIADGQRFTGGSRGLHLRGFNFVNNAWESIFSRTYDTYANESACDSLASDLENEFGPGDLIVITSYDAYRMNANLAGALEDYLNLNVSPPIVSASRSSFVCIAVYANGGISFTNVNEGSSVHANLLLNSSGLIINDTPMKTAKEMVGTTVTLSLQANGLANDRLHGQAIVKNWKANGAQGNLATGGFSFIGSGPLI
jgi:hypothetical protein